MSQSSIDPAARTPRPLIRRPNMGLWEWLSIYVAGAGLIFFILAHVLMVHYLGPVGPFTADIVREKLKSAAYIVLDLGLLFFVFYHGLAGVRRVIIDLEIFGAMGLKVFTGILVLIGLVGIFFGIQIFIAFKV